MIGQPLISERELSNGKRHAYVRTIFLGFPSQFLWESRVFCTRIICTMFAILSKISLGLPVYMLGHGLFGESHALKPSVMRGCIAKVVKIKQQPCMIQVKRSDTIITEISY